MTRRANFSSRLGNLDGDSARHFYGSGNWELTGNRGNFIVADRCGNRFGTPPETVSVPAPVGAGREPGGSERLKTEGGASMSQAAEDRFRTLEALNLDSDTRRIRRALVFFHHVRCRCGRLLNRCSWGGWPRAVALADRAEGT